MYLNLAKSNIVILTFLLLPVNVLIEGCDGGDLPENTTAVVPKYKVMPSKQVPNMVLAPPDSIGPLDWQPQFDSALLYQTLYLLRRSTREHPLHGISKQDMLHTLHILEDWKNITPRTLYEAFDMYRIQTDMRAEKVRLTGYYTPVLHVSKSKTAQFTVPILRRPRNWTGEIPTTEAILNGALSGMGLEIAWCKSTKQLRNAQLQGSCMIEFPDGKRKFLGFDGTNKSMYYESLNETLISQTEQPIADLGKAYVFFQERGSNAWGAAGFPLTAGYSIAVDQRVVPLGSALLARFPVRDTDGKIKIIHRILLAQDTGGSVKTTGHMDLYCGVGEEGLRHVQSINGLAKFWLLQPRKQFSSPK